MITFVHYIYILVDLYIYDGKNQENNSQKASKDLWIPFGIFILATAAFSKEHGWGRGVHFPSS